MTNKLDGFDSELAHEIFMHKYSMNGLETWEDTCKRVIKYVTRQHLSSDLQNELLTYMVQKKFIPAGRYLYSAGREKPQIFNCFAFRAEDSREGWAQLLHDAASVLMLGGGVGVNYSDVRPEGAPIRGTGGWATGPIALMDILNETGRGIMQGGSRRSALMALLSWSHHDIFKFMAAKDQTPELMELKAKDYNFPLRFEGTNISVAYNTEFFIAIKDRKHPNHKLAKQVWETNCRQAFSTAEPGMSFDFLSDQNDLRNPCQPANAPLLKKGIGLCEMRDVKVGDEIWDGSKWVRVSKKWSTGVKPVYRYDTTCGYFLGTQNHRVMQRGEKVEVKDVKSIDVALGTDLMDECIGAFKYHESLLSGLMLGDGGVHKASNNLPILYVGINDQDYLERIPALLGRHRPGIKSTAYEITEELLRSDIREQLVVPLWEREIPSYYMYRASSAEKQAFLRGLFSANGTVTAGRVQLKTSSEVQAKQVQVLLSSLGMRAHIAVSKAAAIKHHNGVYTSKPSYNVALYSSSERFQKFIGFIQKYKNQKPIISRHSRYTTSPIKKVTYMGDEEVFDITVDSPEHVYWTGGHVVSNCGEFITSTNADRCNLGTIWLPHIKDKEELARVTYVATQFLLCGGLYTYHPIEETARVGLENNRVGLGLGGFHEWLMQRGADYEVTPELHKWLNIYERESDSAAYIESKELGVTLPKSKRAIAPNGTLGLLAGTTSGIEPLFAKAYMRRYLEGKQWKSKCVVDGITKRLLERGVDGSVIKDAGDITFKQRVKFQADVQQYVDMGISSTCNLDAWGSDTNNEETLKSYSRILLKYAPRLRGFTCYPDGCRQGQPLTRLSLEEALKQEGVVYEDQLTECKGGVCGI